MTIYNDPRTPHFELQPAPPKKHLKPNDQLEKNNGLLLITQLVI